MISILQTADVGRKPEERAREHGMTVGTFYDCKANFSSTSVNEARCLPKMKEHICQRKSLVADQALTNQMLRSVMGKARPTAASTRSPATYE
jgi:hypothetical protein